MSKLYIISDTHIGYRQYGLKDRNDDFENAFENFYKAIPADSEVLHGGDILHQKCPYSSSIAFLKELNAIQIRKNITTYIISGNHEKSKPSWIDIVEQTDSDYGFKCIDNQTVELKNGMTVHGLPEMSKDQYLDVFNTLDKNDILMLHTAVLEFIGYPSEKALSIEAGDLPTAKFKYIVVGDTHVSSVEESEDGCKVISPGSTEMNSESEPFTKYFYEILEDGKLEAHKLETRKVFQFSIDSDKSEQEAFDTIKGYEDKPCMVFLHISKEYAHVYKRMLSYLSEKAIIRKRTLPTEEERNMVSMITSSMLTTPVDVLPKIVKSDDPIYAPLEEILQLGVEASSMDIKETLQQFCDSRLEQLKQEV